MRKMLVLTMIVTFGMFLTTGNAFAYGSWKTAVEDAYPTATNTHTCGTCHENFGSGRRNSFGRAVGNNPGGDKVDRLISLELVDSDGDGSTNVEEFMAGAGFFPGYTCDNYQDTSNGPQNLVDLVEPLNVGCSTGPPPHDMCDVDCSGVPVATDALIVLNRAVGVTGICEGCGTSPGVDMCDVDCSGRVVATDALIVLNRSVGTIEICTCPG